MLRLNYKLYNGIQPQDAIVAAVSSISQTDDLFMGQCPTDDGYMYGEINTDSSNQSTIETALTNWSAVFLTDNQAKQRFDDALPTNTVTQKKKKAKAARINSSGHVVKEEEEED